MRKLAVVALVFLLVAGCSGGDKEIAGVGDSVVRLSDVESLFDGGAPSDDVFRDMLFSKLALDALIQALDAKYQAAPDAEAATAYAGQLADALEQQGMTISDYLGVANASEAMLQMHSDVLAVQQATLDKLIVDDKTVDELFADPATMTQVCVKHVLVETEEEAQAVVDRLEGGEDFATVADDVSLDTSAEGGDLGCVSAGSFVDEFAAAALSAEIGAITGPVESEFGFHVLVVSERTVPTREEYLADPWSMLSDSQLSLLWATWMSDVLTEADVWVDPEYGVWSPTGIEAPGSETTTTTSIVPTTTTSG